jgi:anion-transporting  ArsA/GET3 family ATPase
MPESQPAWVSAKVVMVAGPGGVGKTSIAAALGTAAAQLTDAKVLVLTVDPARRLADALGIDLPGQEATRVNQEVLTSAGVLFKGELWAGMLDVRAGWDELIGRHAPTVEIAERILANPLYANLTRRFVHSHDYLAIERVHELTTRGDFDVVIVDTPPSRNALDLLDAPRRMQEFFGSQLLRWLTVPARSRMANLVSQPFQLVADRLLGAGFLSDITEFFDLFQTMEEGFVRHAREVEAQMANPETQFVVVTTAEVTPVHEARFLMAELANRGMHLGAVVANRITPDQVTSFDVGSRESMAAATEQVADLATQLAAAMLEVPGEDETAVKEAIEALLHQLQSRAVEIAELATHQERVLSELEIGASLLLRCPILDRDVQDLSDLAELATHLTGPFLTGSFLTGPLPGQSKMYES